MKKCKCENTTGLYDFYEDSLKLYNYNGIIVNKKVL